MVTKLSNRFELTQSIYRGEDHSIFLAFDRQTGRNVHLTILPIAPIQTQTTPTDLERDNQAIRSLKHDHILPILETIRDGDRFYIVSNSIEGETLEKRLKGSALNMDEAIQIIRQIGEALEALHQIGIIHGDLKPAHIFLSKDRGVFLTGFGIHRHVSEMYQENPEFLVGPLGYLSPEHILGGDALDRRSDLYSLGVIFFRMIAGELPYKTSSALSTAMQHCLLPVPELPQKSIPGPIKKAIRKAIQKKPADRFRSIRAFLRKLDYRKTMVRRWAASFSILVCLILGTMMLLKFPPAPLEAAIRGIIPRVTVISEIPNPTDARDLPESTPTLSPFQAAEIVDADTTPKSSPTPTIEIQLLTPTPTPNALSTQVPTITSIYFQTAVAYSTTYTIQVNDTVFDIASKTQKNLAYLLGINSMTCDAHLYTGKDMIIPAEGIIAYPSAEIVIDSNNVDHLRLIHNLECMNNISDVRFSPDGTILAVASQQNVFLWRISDWKPLYRIKGHGDRVIVMTFSPDGEYLTTGSADNAVRVWSIKDAQLVQTLKHNDDITDLAYSPDGHQLTVTSLSLSAIVYTVSDWSQLHQFKGYKTNSAAYSPDGQILAISFNDRVDLFDTQRFSLIRSLPYEPAGRNLVFSPTGSLLASSNNVWQVSDGRHIHHWEGPFHRVVFSPDMETVWVGPRVIQTRNGEQIGKLELQIEPTDRTAYAYDSISLSPDGKMLAWGNQDGVFIYHGIPQPPLIAQSENVHYVEAGENFFTVAAQHRVRLENLFKINTLTCQNVPYIRQSLLIPAEKETRVTNRAQMSSANIRNLNRIQELDLSCAGEFGKLHFSENQGYLLSGTEIWNLETGSILIQGQSSSPARSENILDPIPESTTKISPNHRTAVTIAGAQAQVWDLESGKLLRMLEGHTNRITTFAYSADGKLLASSGLDETIRLWQVETGKELDSMRGFTAQDLIFLPGGQMLISVAGDTARFWSLEIGSDGETAVFLEKQSGTPKKSIPNIDGTYRLTADGKYFSYVACEKREGSHCTQQYINSIRTDQLVDSHRYLGLKELIQDFAFSLDGKLIAIASDNTVIIWEVENEKKLHHLVGDTWAEERIQSLAFTPDSSVLITQVDNRLLRVWDVESGKVLHTQRVNGLQTWAISLDQTLLAILANQHISIFGITP